MRRERPKKTSETLNKKERILFFDIIRILCVLAIVYDHSRYYLIPWFNQFFFPDGSGPFNIYSNGLQGFAVFGMILISGAVLEYNYQSLDKVHGYLKFLFKRFIRIYPAFWMSLIFGLIVFPRLWQNSIPSLLFEFTGFFVILGRGPGIINNMGWFIAAIVSLYILFPWFSKIIRRYGLGALACFCIISWGLRFLIPTYNIVPVDLFSRWFPLCNAFEFCIGIYIVQAGLYPKKVTTSPIIKELSDLSFYAFIFHVLVIGIFLTYLVQPLVTFDTMLAMNNRVVGDTLFYIQMMTSVLLVSWIAMIIDNRIKNWIFQCDCIKKFLKT